MTGANVFNISTGGNIKTVHTLGFDIQKIYYKMGVHIKGEYLRSLLEYIYKYDEEKETQPIINDYSKNQLTNKIKKYNKKYNKNTIEIIYMTPYKETINVDKTEYTMELVINNDYLISLIIYFNLYILDDISHDQFVDYRDYELNNAIEDHDSYYRTCEELPEPVNMYNLIIKK